MNISLQVLKYPASKKLDNTFRLFARAWKYAARTDFVPESVPISCLIKMDDRYAGFAHFEDKNPAVLNLVWIDPRFRRRGILKTAYKQMLDIFGPFVFSPPISKNMANFLMGNITTQQEQLYEYNFKEEVLKEIISHPNTDFKEVQFSESPHIFVGAKENQLKEEHTWLEAAVERKRLLDYDKLYKAPMSITKLGLPQKPWSDLCIKHKSWEDSLALEGMLFIKLDPAGLPKFELVR